MRIELVAEYGCGHPPLTVFSERTVVKRLHQTLKDVIERITSKDGKVHVTCKNCNRGAARLILKLDGKVINVQQNRDFLIPGAVVSVAPPVESN